MLMFQIKYGNKDNVRQKVTTGQTDEDKVLQEFREITFSCKDGRRLDI